MNKFIEVKYFAILREQAGIAEEKIATPARTTGELLSELSQIHEFSVNREYVKVSVNETFESMDYQLETGDRIVFIPPVAGG